MFATHRGGSFGVGAWGWGGSGLHIAGWGASRKVGFEDGLAGDRGSRSGSIGRLRPRSRLATQATSQLAEWEEGKPRTDNSTPGNPQARTAQRFTCADFHTDLAVMDSLSNHMPSA